MTFPFESFFSSSTNGSDRPAGAAPGFFDEIARPGEAADEAFEKRLAEGRRVEAGK